MAYIYVSAQTRPNAALFLPFPMPKNVFPNLRCFLVAQHVFFSFVGHSPYPALFLSLKSNIEQNPLHQTTVYKPAQ